MGNVKYAEKTFAQKAHRTLTIIIQQGKFVVRYVGDVIPGLVCLEKI